MKNFKPRSRSMNTLIFFPQKNSFPENHLSCSCPLGHPPPLQQQTSQPEFLMLSLWLLSVTPTQPTAFERNILNVLARIDPPNFIC